MIRQVGMSQPLQGTPAWTQAIFKAEDVPSGSVLYVDDKNQHPSKEDVKTALVMAMRAYGAYNVARIFAEVAADEAAVYRRMDNMGAIIHSDARYLGEACNRMRVTHPMRIPDEVF